jgi:hypothetical protein
MVRNLKIVKGFPQRPGLICRKKIGLPMDKRIRKAIRTITGALKINAGIVRKRSRQRFFIINVPQITRISQILVKN